MAGRIVSHLRDTRTHADLTQALCGLYAGIVYREPARDERERLHVARAERIGFLVSTGMLVAFIGKSGRRQEAAMEAP